MFFQDCQSRDMPDVNYKSIITTPKRIINKRMKKWLRWIKIPYAATLTQ